MEKNHQVSKKKITTKKLKIKAGIVVANDADAKRCYTLTHQIQRLGSECCLVTNHEAQMFPYIKITPKQGEEVLEGKNIFFSSQKQY